MLLIRIKSVLCIVYFSGMESGDKDRKFSISTHHVWTLAALSGLQNPDLLAAVKSMQQVCVLSHNHTAVTGTQNIAAVNKMHCIANCIHLCRPSQQTKALKAKLMIMLT